MRDIRPLGSFLTLLFLLGAQFSCMTHHPLEPRVPASKIDQAKRLKAPFSEDEIQYLSGTLSKTFAGAQPEEWVVFGLSQPDSPGITRITTGGWFLEGSNLHLVFANYRDAVTMSGVRERLMKDPLYPNTDSNFDLIPGEYQTAIRDTRVIRSLLAKAPPELSIAYKPLLLAAAVSQPAADSKRSPDRSSTNQPSPSSSELSLEEPAGETQASQRAGFDYRGRLSGQEGATAGAILTLWFLSRESFPPIAGNPRPSSR